MVNQKLITRFYFATIAEFQAATLLPSEVCFIGETNNWYSASGDIVSANERVFADEATVAPASAGEATLVEITAFVAAGSHTDTVIFYTGTDANTDTVVSTYHVDISGNVTPMASQSATQAAPSTQAEVTAGTAVADKYVQPDTLKVELDKKEALIDATAFEAVGSENAIGINTGDDTAQKVFDKLNSFSPEEGLRGEPVATNAELTAITAKDYERRKVLIDGKEYVFELGAVSGTLPDDGVTGFWQEQIAEGLVTTYIDSSAGATVETLAASTGAGVVRLFTNTDVTNSATLTVQTGETLNGVVDATFFFSNYLSGTQFRSDEVTGGWVVSVVGASVPVDSLSETFDPSVELTVSTGTLVYADPFITTASSNIVIDNTGRCSVTRIGGDKALVTIAIGHDIDSTTEFTLSNAICPGKILSVGSTMPSNNANENYRINHTGAKTFEIDRPTGVNSTYQFSFVIVVDGFDELNNYVLAGMVTPTSISSVFASLKLGNGSIDFTGANTDVIFENTKETFGTDISLNNTTGEFTLKAGRRYELEASLYAFNFSNPDGQLQTSWVDASNVKLPISEDGFHVPTTRSNNGGISKQPITKAIITPTVDTVVKLRVTAAIGTASISSVSWVNVKSVPTSTVVMPDAVPVEDLARGSERLASDYDISGTGGIGLPEDIGVSVTLPNVGTYELKAMITAGQVGDDQYISAIITDSSDVAVSEFMPVVGTTDQGGLEAFYSQGSATIIAYVTTTSANESFKIRVSQNNNTATGQINAGTTLFYDQKPTKTIGVNAYIVPVEDVQVVEGYVSGIVNNDTAISVLNTKTWDDLKAEYEYIKFEFVGSETLNKIGLPSVEVKSSDLVGDMQITPDNGRDSGDIRVVAVLDLTTTGSFSLVQTGNNTSNATNYDSVAIRVVGVKAQKTVINTTDTPVTQSSTATGFVDDIGVRRTLTQTVTVSTSTDSEPQEFPQVFETTFSSAPVIVGLTKQGNSNGATGHGTVTDYWILEGSVTTTGFTLVVEDSSNSGGVKFNFQAIGLKQ